ncbi:MAG: hypothetical protein K2Q25_07815 [Mycobacteriaceae bacterium]|nr:hypothetical protein [Mycobacteriaceae bacterium]
MTPAVTPEYWALRIDGTAQGAAIAQAMQAALAFGYSGEIKIYMANETPTWRLQITDTQGVDQIAYQGDWMVLANNALSFYKDADFTEKFAVES